MTSTPSGGSNDSTKSRVSAGPLNIFQLPAISIVGRAPAGCRCRCRCTPTHRHLGSRRRRATPCPRAARGKPRRRSRPTRSRSSSPSSVIARTESPPPTTVKPSHSATACATAFVPAAKRSHSKTPIGPFQKTVFALRIFSAKSSPVSGPMSRPSQPVRHLVPAHDPALGVLLEGGRCDDVDGKAHRGLQRVLLAELLGHLAADQHRVDVLGQVLEHAELVLHLEPADDRKIRSLDLPEQSAQHLQLPLEQEASVGGQQVRDRLGRAVGAVRRAEGIVDVEVTAVGELAREALVVLGLAGVEARVLEHVDPLVRKERAQVLGDRLRSGSRDRRPSAGRGESRPGSARHRARAGARASAAPRGSACRPRPCRPRAARSGRRGGGRPCRRPPRRGPSAASSERASRSDRPADSYSPTRCRTSRRP